MCWATFWATFLQTRLVTLPLVQVGSATPNPVVNDPSRGSTVRKKIFGPMEQVLQISLSFQSGLPDGICSCQQYQVGYAYFGGPCKGKFWYIL
jgi:hypothetical protein